ncbi:hypothetical protein ABEB36_007974 [Hypothenemus hampei]|uniref:Uncharacterized protein n=1 Tax=Hypothenemus hampei TaxID=57062 RepID=A0ABD1EK92_HYPHA
MILEKTKPDTLLFGPDLGEKIKTAKSVEHLDQQIQSFSSQGSRSGSRLKREGGQKYYFKGGGIQPAIQATTSRTSSQLNFQRLARRTRGEVSTGLLSSPISPIPPSEPM